MIRKVLVVLACLALQATLVLAAPISPPNPGVDKTHLWCQQIPGLEAALANDVVLVGEVYGTEESPAFVLQAVCTALGNGRRVTVALEVPREEEPFLQTYLSSPRDNSSFLEGPFWHSSPKEGRSSKAMAGLVTQLRSWHAMDIPVRIATIDPTEIAPDGTASHWGAARDRGMAENLAALIKAAPHDLVLVLTGNVLNRTERGVPWNKKYEPMGFLLRQRLAPAVRLASLDVHLYGGGKAWVCTNRTETACGSIKIRPKVAPPGEKAPVGVILQSTTGHLSVGYYYFRTPVHASPPAIPVGH
jgi:hypothetical protein